MQSTILKTILLLAIAALPAFAQQTSPAAPTPQAQSDPYHRLIDAGFGFPIYYTGEVLGNTRGGYQRGAIYDGLLEAGITADLGKLAHWTGATFAADAYFPHGESLSQRDVHDMNGVSNIDAFHFPRLYDLWLQQDMLDGKLSIRVGQIAADTAFSFPVYGTPFMNSAFGAAPTVSLNVSAPVFPAAAPGAQAWVKPDCHWTLLGAVFTGDTGDSHGADRNGTNFNFNPRNGALCMAETDYTLNPPLAAPADGKAGAPTSRPLSGTYKIGGYLDTMDFTDVKTGGTLHGDYGGYVVIDQEVWHEPGAPEQGLRSFCRCGCAPGDRNHLCFDCETGLNYAGLIPGRDRDIAGLAFAYTKVSDGVLDNAGTAPARHYESIIELTYQAAVNDHLTLQPDLQYVFNPGGGAEPLANALVLGLRFSLAF